MNILLSLFLILFAGSPSTDDNSSSAAEKADRVEIVIEGNDQMKFNKEEITVKEGDTIVLTLKHVGDLPKAAMGHNWVLLKQGTDVKGFAMEALRAKDNDYVPEGTEAVITHTELIGGGQETTIEFEAPAPGEYDFICSFPGHYALMQGKFIVE